MSKQAIPYWQVDAFTARAVTGQAFGGNPAALMVLDEWLPDARLLQIASEVGLPASGFVVKADERWELCWFSPTREIALCGHASLAAGHVLLARENTHALRFATRHSGELEVRRADEGYELALPVTATEPRAYEEAAALMGGAPVAVHRSAHGHNIFVFDSEAAVRALTPDHRGLAALGTDQFIATAPGDSSDIVSRVFVPGGGAAEDSVTGSAHAALAPYWAKRLGHAAFTAHQASARGGDLSVRLEGDRVWLGGQCVTVIEGTISL